MGVVLLVIAGLLSLINAFFINQHGVIKGSKLPKIIKKTELRRYGKYVITIGIVTFLMTVSAWFLDKSLLNYIFGGIAIKIAIPTGIWLGGLLNGKVT
ncbi:hypothetical protein IT402_02250 [Candidatus Nomurabacteria bacterium]|nr:hypothetical protein [Candidatus Nomurabacteria bacterium]